MILLNCVQNASCYYNIAKGEQGGKMVSASESSSRSLGGGGDGGLKTAGAGFCI